MAVVGLFGEALRSFHHGHVQITSRDVRNRVRHSRMGPQEELPNQRHIFPLYSVTALRVAFVLRHQACESELLHYEITRRCSDDLARHRFDRGGWDPVHLNEQPPTHADPAPARQPAASATSAGSARSLSGSLMQNLQRSGFDERKEFFRDVVEDDDNAAWQFIDHSATGGALDRFGDLSNRERRELFGALTALL